MLPAGLYKTQYKFSGGQRVDAVVKVTDKFLPIDSKFPLESFQRIIESENDSTGVKDFKESAEKNISMI